MNLSNTNGNYFCTPLYIQLLDRSIFFVSFHFISKCAFHSSEIELRKSNVTLVIWIELDSRRICLFKSECLAALRSVFSTEIPRSGNPDILYCGYWLNRINWKTTVLISICCPGEIRKIHRLLRWWEPTAPDIYSILRIYPHSFPRIAIFDAFLANSTMLLLSSTLLLLLIGSFVTTEKVCPGYGFVRPPDKCESTCSTENEECPPNRKCCFRIEQPCGYHCIVPKDDVGKVGKCPSTSSEVNDPYWNICDGHFCDVDNDCQGTKKCCRNPCGSPLCLPPQWITHWRNDLTQWVRVLFVWKFPSPTIYR